MSFEPLIRSLYDAHGELTAEMVVEEARPVDAVLHPFFEWDDSVAAELHRQEQARSMIRRVRFVVESQDGSPRDVVREFRVVTEVHGDSEPRRVYRRVSEMTPAEREEVLDRMRRSIASLVRSYREYDEFWTALREQIAEAS